MCGRVCAPTAFARRGGLDRLPVLAPESRCVKAQRRCGRSGQIVRAASACAGAGERGADSESGAEAGTRFGEDRAGGDPRRPTRVCEDSASARSSRGVAEDRLGQGRPHPRPLWDRSLKDARRSERSAAGRADQPLPQLRRQRQSVPYRERHEMHMEKLCKESGFPGNALPQGQRSNIPVISTVCPANSDSGSAPSLCTPTGTTGSRRCRYGG
jgi:hypothetical protein